MLDPSVVAKKYIKNVLLYFPAGSSTVVQKRKPTHRLSKVTDVQVEDSFTDNDFELDVKDCDGGNNNNYEILRTDLPNYQKPSSKPSKQRKKKK